MTEQINQTEALPEDEGLIKDMAFNDSRQLTNVHLPSVYLENSSSGLYIYKIGVEKYLAKFGFSNFNASWYSSYHNHGLQITANGVAQNGKLLVDASMETHIVSGGRSVDTKYTNNTGKPMTVTFSGYTPAGDGNLRLYAVVDDANVAAASNNEDLWTSVSFVVPSGSTYKITDRDGNMASTIYWTEVY